MSCECVLAGWCERHKVYKGQAWHALCQTRPDYFVLWEAGRGPGQPITEATCKVSRDHAQARQKRTEARNVLTRQLWKEIHSIASPTPAWFEAWRKRIPRFGCGCKAAFSKIIASNPPRYADWFDWSVEVHNAVNRKVPHAEITLEEAKAIWLRS